MKSDNNMLKLEIDLEFHKERKPDNLEVFNVRNKLNQQIFYQFTSKDKDSVNVLALKWRV